MVQRPLANEAGGLRRQGAVDDFAVLDPDEGLEALICGVEVGRRMLVMVHADDDAEEEGNDGHSTVRRADRSASKIRIGLLPRPRGADGYAFSWVPGISSPRSSMNRFFRLASAAESKTWLAS